jgi:hypothetical protein
MKVNVNIFYTHFLNYKREHQSIFSNLDVDSGVSIVDKYSMNFFFSYNAGVQSKLKSTTGPANHIKHIFCVPVMISNPDFN